METLVNNKGLVFVKTIKKTKGNAYLFSSNCTKCQKELLVVRCRVNLHKGLCRVCSCTKMIKSQIKKKKEFKSKLDDIAFTDSGKSWSLVKKRDKTGKCFYHSDCDNCGKIMRCEPFKLKRHRGICRTCTINKRKKQDSIDRAKKLQKIKREENYKPKSKTLGQRIIQFDSQRNNSVPEFNRIFKTDLIGNFTDFVEIGKPFTDRGRFIYINGIEYKQIFEVN